MGLINSIFTILTVIWILSVSVAYAAWQEPDTIVTGTWGAVDEQFGIEYGDSGDMFSGPFYVLGNSEIIIRDVLNGRYKVYNSDGSIKKVLKCVEIAPDIYNEECNIEGAYLQIKDDGNMLTDASKYKKTKYLLYSPTGELLQTFTEKPVELGTVKFFRTSNGYRYLFNYPDISNPNVVVEYPVITQKRNIKKYTRDTNGYLYTITIAPGENTNDMVTKYDRCGKGLGQMQLPDNEITLIDNQGDQYLPDVSEVLTVEYGEPVVSPNGDVYTWKRTPDNYSILKWTWVDSPDDPKGGPDTPAEVQALPSNSGIYLTWNPAPQDPGCVSGYEIERASAAGGPYSPVATVPLDEKQTYNYNDTAAGAGQTWYYRIRSASDIGNSDPAEVSAARP